MKKIFISLLCLLLTVSFVITVFAVDNTKKETSGNKLSPPVISSFANTRSGLKISWEKTDGTDYYRIYKRTEDNKWAVLKTLKSTEFSYTDATAKSGKSEEYCMRAYNKEHGVWSKTGPKESFLYIATPAVTVKNDADGIKISWKRTTGTLSTRIYKKNADGWQCLKKADNTVSSFTDKAVKNNTQYSYYVKAYSKDTKSERTEIIKQKFLKAPGSLKSSVASDGIKISWDKVTGAGSYYVYKKTAKTDYSRIANVKTNSYTDTSVKNNTKYTYTVKAKYKNFTSYQNKQETSCTFIKAPVLSSANTVKGGVKLTIKEYKNISKFCIFRKTPGGKYSLIKETTSLTFTDKTAKKGKTYIYTLKAKTKSGTSGISNEIKVRLIDYNKPMVALTYDDGPYSPNTDRILDALEKAGGKATFFVVGNRVNTYKSSVKRAAKMGCEIGNHTYTHDILTDDSASQIKSELKKCNDAVKSVTGTAPVIMRPPGGAVNSTAKSACNMPMIIWSIDTRDWETQSASSTVSVIKNQVEDGDIILMHDLYSATASASEAIIPWLVSKGYQLVTVSELMQAKGITMKGSTQYFSAD